jgi:large subunit ribosomal protein L31e
MSQELERIYTINLGKVLLTPNNQRAKRAINMVKEFARHHMKTEEVKIDEDVSHQIWKRGIRHPPRKIRVKMTKTDEGFVLVSPYEEEIESEVKPQTEQKIISDKKETKAVTEAEPKHETIEEQKSIDESKQPKLKIKESLKTEKQKPKESPKQKRSPKPQESKQEKAKTKKDTKNTKASKTTKIEKPKKKPN